MIDWVLAQFVLPGDTGTRRFPTLQQYCRASSLILRLSTPRYRPHCPALRGEAVPPNSSRRDANRLKLSRVCSVRYRYSRYRYGCRTELTEVSGTGIDVPNLPKCQVPVLMLYRNNRSVRYRYESLYRYRRCWYPYRTELAEVSGTGFDVIPNIPKCPVPVLMSYRSYLSIWYRY